MAARLGAIRQKAQRKGEYGFICPGKPGSGGCSSAPEGKVRLWVSPDGDRFHCWHCGFGGRSLAPLMVPGSAELREYLESRPAGPRPRCVVDVRPRCTALPEGYRPFRLRGDVGEAPYLTYLRRRGVTDHSVELYRMGYVDDGPLRGRVVVPSFDAAGLVNFWSARAVDEREGLRYRLPLASKDVVSNEHLVDWTRPVYLVEGIFDEVAVGPQGIALYGKFMSPQLALRLVERRPPRVNVCLDDDAEAEAWDLIGRLMSYDLPCAMVRLGEKDPAVAGASAVANAAASALLVTGSASLVGARL